MYALRPYQQDSVNQIRAKYRTGCEAVLYVLPTSGGKTVVFSYIAESAYKRNKQVIITVHRRELLQQASRKLTESGVPHGLISPEHPSTNHAVQVASVQTLVRRLDTIPCPDLLVIDECHHVSSNKSSWRTVCEAYKQARILGVTATPCRLDGAGLGVQVGGIFDAMVVGPSIQELTDLWFISECDVYSPPTDVHVEKLHTLAGDYKKDEMEQEMDRPVITGSAVKHYRKICDGVPAIAFCVSVQHAKNVANEFRQAGYTAVAVDGTMRETDRDLAMDGLRTGKIQIVTSCEIISEGVDVPVVTAGIMLRPTQSMSLHLQQCGRILRICPGKKKAIILDHVGNCLRHGLPHEDREWSLNAVKEDRRKKSDAPALRQCPKCYFVSKPSPACPNCGYEYPKEPRVVDQVEGELSKLTPEEFAARRVKMKLRQQVGMCKELKALIELGRQRGYEPGWAHYIWRARQRDKANWGGAIAI